MLKTLIKRSLAAAIAAALLAGVPFVDTAQTALARNSSSAVSNRPSAPSAEQINRRKILARQEAAAKAKREAEARAAEEAKREAETAKLQNEKEKNGTKPKEKTPNATSIDAATHGNVANKDGQEAATKAKREAEARAAEKIKRETEQKAKAEAAKSQERDAAKQTEKLIEPDDEAALIERYSRTGKSAGTNAAGQTNGVRPLGGSEVSRGGSILRSRARAEKEQRKEKKPATAATSNDTVSTKGWKVKEAQRKLAILGYEPGKVTGELNAATERALKKFQDDNGLKETGKLDNKTYEKISWKAFSRTGIRSIKGGDIVKQASRYKGTPYVFGGTTPKGFDCSGYVQYVFKQKGAKLGRTADAQALEGIFVTQRKLKPGDLVFFTTYEAGASHVGIYAGAGKFWNATSSRGVMLCDMQDSYWKSRYYGARRVLVENGEN